jgi:hypothetical protein
MNTQLITASYSESIQVDFTQDAWFNATAVAAQFDKRVNDWTSLESTKEYINALTDIFRNQESRFLKVKRGGRGKSDSTWFHPKLAIPFARWLDVRFAVWCDLQIETILKGQAQAAPIPFPKTQKALPGGLTLEQQDAVKALVRSRVEVLPKAKQGKAAITCWSSIKSKFKVKTYKEVPPEHFGEVLSLIARLPLEGEHIPASKPDPKPEPQPHFSRSHNYGRARELLAYLRGFAGSTFPGNSRDAFTEALDELERCLIAGWTEIDEAMLRFHLGMDMLRRWMGCR